MSDHEETTPAPASIGEVQAMKCADCAASDSAATDVRPTGAMPIPAEVFAGETRSLNGLSRRAFLGSGVAGVAAVYAATRIDWSQMWEAAIAEGASDPANCLVVIYLNGGNDGLNAIVPLGTTDVDAAYKAARPNIQRFFGPSAGANVGTTVIPATGGGLGFANVLVSGAANNGDTKGLDTIYGDGVTPGSANLAIFPAADYTPPNLSHFESRDYWFAGALQSLTTGWLGRWLDIYGSTTNPLQAISLDSNLSKQIRSSRAPVAALNNLSGVNFSLDNVGTRVDPTAEVGKLATVPASAGNAALTRSRGTFGTTVQVSQTLRGLVETPGGGYPPNSALSSDLQLAAFLLSAGLGTKIITIDWGSFDTHSNQVASQDPQLKVLSSALAAFQADLAARNIGQNVTTLVFSEFGRRVMSNQSAGTDHGAGGLMMVAGPKVRGGMVGSHPGVANLDSNGDLQVTTDFRSVYSSIISEWLGGDPAAVLPGGPPSLGTNLFHS